MFLLVLSNPLAGRPQDSLSGDQFQDGRHIGEIANLAFHRMEGFCENLISLLGRFYFVISFATALAIGHSFGSRLGPPKAGQTP